MSAPPPPPGPARRPRGGPRDLFAGVGYFARGMGWAARRPRQWLFGLIPALIVVAVYTAALVVLGLYVADIADAVTPFADDWSEGVRDTVRVLAAVLIMGASVMFAVVTFTTVTLLVGDPFYESLSTRVEQEEGGLPPEYEASLWRQFVRALGDGLAVALMTGAFAVVFFILGFLPIIGQTVVPVVAACVGGFFLTAELTSIALDRRGVRRRARFVLLRKNTMLTVGFGVTVFVVFMIPLGAIIAMPGAVAGGTLLARERLASVPGGARPEGPPPGGPVPGGWYGTTPGWGR